MTRHAILATLGSFVLTALATHATAAGQSPPGATLDFEYFKTRVQPIFAAKRPGHARCISCHIAGTPLRLQPFSSGTTWNEEESRKNFDAMKRVVMPGNEKSRLLVHPLAEGRRRFLPQRRQALELRAIRVADSQGLGRRRHEKDRE